MRRWAVVFGKHASDHVFIDIHSKRLVDLLGDSGAAEAGITLFQFNNNTNEIIRGAFRSRLCAFP